MWKSERYRRYCRAENGPAFRGYDTAHAVTVKREHPSRGGSGGTAAPSARKSRTGSLAGKPLHGSPGSSHIADCKRESIVTKQSQCPPGSPPDRESPPDADGPSKILTQKMAGPSDANGEDDADTTKRWKIMSSTSPSDSDTGSRSPPEASLRALMTANKRYHNKVLGRLAVIMDRLSALEYKVHQLSNPIVQNGSALPDTEAGDEEILKKLPLATHDDFLEAEDFLTDISSRKLMVSLLKTTGGKSPRHATMAVMARILTRELASTFSYAGRGGKKEFRRTRIAAVVSDAVRYMFPSATDLDIKDAIMDFLRVSPSEVRRKQTLNLATSPTL